MLQEVSNTIRQLPNLTRREPVFYTAIEENVEGFVEDSLTRTNCILAEKGLVKIQFPSRATLLLALQVVVQPL